MSYCWYCAWVDDGYAHPHYFIAPCDEDPEKLQREAEATVDHEEIETEYNKVGPVTQSTLDTIADRMGTGPLRLNASGKVEEQTADGWRVVPDYELDGWYRNSFD